MLEESFRNWLKFQKLKALKDPLFPSRIHHFIGEKRSFPVRLRHCPCCDQLAANHSYHLWWPGGALPRGTRLHCQTAHTAHGFVSQTSHSAGGRRSSITFRKCRPSWQMCPLSVTETSISSASGLIKHILKSPFAPLRPLLWDTGTRKLCGLHVNATFCPVTSKEATSVCNALY